MIQEAAVRGNLIQVLKGDMSLDAFEDWIVSASWNMHKDSARGVQALVWAIELALSEHSAGHLAEQELIAKFHEMQSSIFFEPPVQRVSTGATQNFRSLLQVA